jgi:hypothetical protein
MWAPPACGGRHVPLSASVFQPVPSPWAMVPAPPLRASGWKFCAPFCRLSSRP